MFRKVHRRLTLLFTIVCIGILAVMAASYILLSVRSIYNSALIRLESNTANFETTLSGSTVISDDWLRNTQSNYNYIFFLYDNGNPMHLTALGSNDADNDLISELRSSYGERINKIRDPWAIRRDVFQCRLRGRTYNAGVIFIPGENGFTDLYILDSLHSERKQIWKLLLGFGAVILLTSAALFAFSWFFTRKLLQPVQRSHEQQAHFIAAASHEIRNPVNTIVSALDAMKECSDEQREDFADIARREGKRLTVLTEDLLTLARSDNGSFTTELNPTELDTLVISCYEAFLAPAKEKSIKLGITLPEDVPPPAPADAERIKQVVSILLSNAVSYTPENGTIDIAYSFDRQRHSIAVSDSGTGISDEDKPHIFERFYRADRAREDRSHFGLGLAIAKEIMDLHNGTITVSDSSTGGAEFTISLKAAPENESAQK